ncbi:hypothetical protein B5807_10991 [Epicoccum nigrum]|uniref:Uncharacterized protein n=1 Tax=Epicoccum nigrum TaxID=105696 RepID=A0A1Y2LM01_EPING|nr:hypothetical protein B5807_10991 [Epicoccum nigrum]
MTHLVHVLDRHERQRKARAVRRELAEITLDNSKLQEQSLLFSKIPAEIRFLIFQFLLSQTYDYNRPVDVHSISPLYRPGHTHRTKIHTAILLTCRLVYFEAHSIPIRSATHHFRHLGSTSWLYEGDVWLHHMTKQRGAEVYHLHDNLVALKEGNFTKFFLPHLHWKRVTWTICSYLWPPILAGYREIDRLAKTLADIDLPASCQEVTLEFEVREDVPEFCEDLQRQAELCMKIGLRRTNGSILQFSTDHSKKYTWIGSGQARWGTSALIRDRDSVRYRTIRLCWRANTPRRAYMSYDHLDCLKLANCKGVERIEERIEG